MSNFLCPWRREARGQNSHPSTPSLLLVAPLGVSTAPSDSDREVHEESYHAPLACLPQGDSIKSVHLKANLGWLAPSAYRAPGQLFLLCLPLLMMHTQPVPCLADKALFTQGIDPYSSLPNYYQANSKFTQGEIMLWKDSSKSWGIVLCKEYHGH